MQRSPRVIAVFLVVVTAAACRSGGVRLPAADAIVEGLTDSTFAVDTIEDGATVGIKQARWVVRGRSANTHDFWSDVAVLDLPAAEHNATSLDQLTFALALKELMASDPERAAVAFSALHVNARDVVVRSRARIGLTMALSWYSDWQALSRIGFDPDTAEATDSLSLQASVERWARALSAVPMPEIDVPESPVTMPLRRSAIGTPVVTVRINGHPHEFWLDTGASMTLLSAAVASEAGVLLAAPDSLALGVVAGHIPARAVLIDSLAFGPVVARGISAALVSSSALRLDHRVVNGAMQTIQIDGVIGTDLMRHLDLVLDAGAGTITIRKPHVDPRSKRNLYWVGYPVVRLVTSDGRPVLFGLDTGAEGTYVTTALLRKLPRTPVAMRRRTISGLGADQIKTEWVARSVSLSDGDYAIAMGNIPVVEERRWTFVTFDGVIGSDVALSSRMHLDFLNGVFDVRRSSRTLPGQVNVTVGHD